MKWIRALVALTISLGLFFILDRPISSAVPFSAGNFFNPFTGFLQNGDDPIPVQETIQLPELQEPVAVSWDDRGIPHIFAQNDRDLYVVQGYLTARDRLWQMDFLSYVAAGRLAEILGNRPGVVAHDRFRRRMGMLYSAENALKAVRQDRAATDALDAYAAGVNAHIRELSPKNLPLEYKIFEYRPEIWTPLKSALVLKLMAWDLTGRNNELPLTKTLSALDSSIAQQIYFPEEPFKMERIIPEDTRWTFSPKIKPQAPEKLFLPLLGEISLTDFQPDPHNGSNNWVVNGKKTADGAPILCNDPHLRLTLPAIWYEMQLVSPSVNVYGVSIPGTPTIIIGFNRRIAWGVTNAGTDVMDWYQVRFRDESASEYLYNGEWHPTTKRAEIIKIRGAETVFDTIPFTHHGLVAYMSWEAPFDSKTPTGAALRWTAHDPSNEVRGFMLLNSAANYREFSEALKFLSCPGQNVAFAAVDGDIALQHTGKFPVRWKNQGKTISDGSDRRYEWEGFIPYEHLPLSVNPKQGFLASANQPPVNSAYPYLMQGEYATFERSARIHERLREMADITPQGMMRLQLDNLNVRARTLMPVMLSVIDSSRLKDDYLLAYRELRSWNFDNVRTAIAPSLFERWYDNAVAAIWKDDLPADSSGIYYVPDDDMTMRLLAADTASSFFDNRDTPEVEKYSHIMNTTFEQTVEKFTHTYGAFGEKWQWGNARGTTIEHLARLPGFGKKHLPTDGDHAIVNAIKRTHGPSWRMIVQLQSPKPVAWGIYPGGQSGNPGDNQYDQFVEPWLNGMYYELLYLTSPKELHERIVGKTLFQNTPQN